MGYNQLNYMKIFNGVKTLKIIGLAALVLIIAALGFRFLSGPEDTWLCQNGQWVKHGQPSTSKPTTVCDSQKLQPGDNGPTVSDQSDLIVVDYPKSGDTVTSPLVVRGKARGNWFFEASFPVKLVASDGTIIAQTPAQAKGDWMTTDFVPFEAKVDFEYTLGRDKFPVNLILKNDNPSGLPQNDKSISVPVILIPGVSASIFKVFFSNNNLDKEVTCTKVFSVDRQVVKTAAVARAALEELLKGPTAEEKAQGYFTSINPGVKIQKLTIADGTAKVDFDGTMEKGMGGSCRVSAIRAEIIETLKQFSTVKNVIISVNGRTEDILQP